MALDLFAGIPVTSYAEALPWYVQFFGAQPSFRPNDTEAVWEVAELPGPFSPEHDREVVAYVDGEIDAAELYRRTVARYRQP